MHDILQIMSSSSPNRMLMAAAANVDFQDIEGLGTHYNSYA